MGAKVIDRDKGWAKAMASLAALQRLRMTVGIHATAEPYPAEGGRQPLNVAQIAAVHEFGGGNVPERPFMRPAVDGHRSAYAAIAQRGMGRVIDGTLTVDQMGDNLGAKVAADIQQAIVDVTSPPLAESTLAGKIAKSKTGAVRVVDGVETGNPLIDTGRMRQSVTWVVDTSGRPRVAED